jgi:hypothetical protein
MLIRWTYAHSGNSQDHNFWLGSSVSISLLWAAYFLRTSWIGRVRIDLVNSAVCLLGPIRDTSTTTPPLPDSADGLADRMYSRVS